MGKVAGILLVDDDGTTNFLHRRLLGKVAPAHPVLVAQHGGEALALLHQVLTAPTADDARFWLVLLDVKMPVVNGFEFLEAYRQWPLAQQRRAAVVMLTTSLHFADLDRLQRLPITGLLSKPLTEAKLAPLLQGEAPVPALVLGPPEERVFQLLYRSRARQPLSEAALYELLSQARRANACEHITGVLLCWKGHYLQVLEGPEAAVRAMYARIERDPRHTQVATLSEAHDRGRSFGYWRMALGSGSDLAVASLLNVLLEHEPPPHLPLGEGLLRTIRATLGRPLS